ncbi:MAG: 23S rRNA (adenine(2030)-N(6))-methyltransferase RlmJ [Magnetococcales bacterium]|nr:23S rRNA (adenine(2030)-N(6))-methyltransferase RlmJ [Magnetococcales bacterium]MBF0322055.1 23S rRNA (adenine(2030)-N(6))-methyltransferase RlmJ [Magnetococcales bacterium]
MLSYQHAYHAGGLADVHKHGSLAVLLAKMVAKEKPLSYLETHAGQGYYDLSGPESHKTGEAHQGILRLLAAHLPPPDHPYRRVIEATQSAFGPSFYPGSPRIAQLLLRPVDRLHLMELHPAAHAMLRRQVRGKNIFIHHRDGHEGGPALLPPQPRRSLILVDPSYEVKTEYDRVGQTILRMHRLCPEAVILLWYPLLKGDPHQPLCRLLTAASLPKFARRECQLHDPAQTERMYGSGLMFINLPHGVEKALDAVEALTR